MQSIVSQVAELAGTQKLLLAFWRRATKAAWSRDFFAAAFASYWF
jgi:hypothetical protein